MLPDEHVLHDYICAQYNRANDAAREAKAQYDRSHSTECRDAYYAAEQEVNRLYELLPECVKNITTAR